MAALAVIITHVELLKMEMGFTHNWNNVFIFNLGGMGVYFFFVLSGFLITYLLLAEKKKKNTIAVKKFYIRRILRIWPLYYLVCVLAFFVFPHINFLEISYLKGSLEQGYWVKLFLFVFMLPNLALAMYKPVPHAGQLWSIGVEEQFYIIWPLIVKYSKKPIKAIVYLSIVILLAKASLLFMSIKFPSSKLLEITKLFFAMSKIECMTIGAVGAYFLFNKNNNIVNVISSKWVLLLSIIGAFFLIYITHLTFIQDGIHIPVSILFLIIILNVAVKGNEINWLNNVVFSNLGKISYGIYMLHMFVVVFVIRTVSQIFNVSKTFSLFENSLIYIFSVFITIIISYISYHFFEKVFLNLKKKYTVIRSSS